MKHKASIRYLQAIKTFCISVLLLVGQQAFADNTIPKHLVKAVDKALNGKGGTVKVFGHDYELYPISYANNTRLSGERVIIQRGRFDHQLALRKDDNIYFEIILEDGKVHSASITNILRGGLLRSGGLDVLIPVIADMNDIISLRLSSEAQRDWEKVAEYIVAVIADRLVVRENMMKRTPPPPQPGAGANNAQPGAGAGNAGSGTRDHREVDLTAPGWTCNGGSLVALRKNGSETNLECRGGAFDMNERNNPLRVANWECKGGTVMLDRSAQQKNRLICNGGSFARD